MDSSAKPFWRDDEIAVDKDGIPHYTGKYPHLMKEYRRRVLFAFNNLEGDGKDQAEEDRDLAKKKARFAKKLLDALHGEAWRACQDLMSQPDDLKRTDGYKLIFQSLQSIEKAPIIRKTEAFDRFFEHCWRRKGQNIDEYLRRRKQDWDDLRDLSDNTTMSEDLLSYFLLKQVNLGKDDRRSILLSNQSDYTIAGIEKALRISFYDVHEKERSCLPRERPQRGNYKKNNWANLAAEDEKLEDEVENGETWDDSYQAWDEEDEFFDPEEGEAAFNAGDDDVGDPDVVSDDGASQDDEVFQAYSTMDKSRRSYKDSRKKLRELQKSRGFFRADVKGELTYEERNAAVEREKRRSRCGACHKIGHWAGDSVCPKSSQGGPKRQDGGKSKGKSRGRGKGKGKGKAYLVGDLPLFFNVEDNDEHVEASAYMLGPGEKEEDQMQQDSGTSDYDKRRKKPDAREVDGTSDWSYVSSAPAAESPEQQQTYSFVGHASQMAPWIEHQTTTTMVGGGSSQVDVMVAVAAENVSLLFVNSYDDVAPDAPLESMKVRDLQSECEDWGLHTTGSKSELVDRLRKFFSGHPVPKKGKSKKFIRLVTENDGVTAENVLQPPVPKAKASASGSASSAAPTVRVTTAVKMDKSFGYAAGADDQEPIPRPSSSAGFVEMPKVSGTFRKDPRTGLSIPSGMQIGKVCPTVPCPVCGYVMVLRENQIDQGLFFGCSRFGSGRCKGTRKFTDVVEEKASPGPARK